ncbi:DNA recombination protein RmuC [Vallicoccus soli]|uniref:DNA recombination protein RmuC n=1 Tax=Vallicoccus soli TaxID=2339232 RepID=A0A3A3Z3J3_9ACTN|nr:DNA recombination protein RmuC [Vallicoccus soli]RJK97984.1 DNA recombination protein RmuC [Vallicoccus soli]
MDPTPVLLLLLGLAAGLALGLLLAQRRALDPAAMEARDRRLLELADARFREAGAAAGGELAARRAEVEGVVAPLRETLARVEGHLHELERARVGAYHALTQQVGLARETSEALREQTASLVSALSAPQARGRWGEVQLRRVVELAGMLERCDFDEQPSVVVDGRVQRPDLVVRLAGGRSVVVDAKVSLAAFLQAAEARDDALRAERLAAHARHLRAHVDGLADKEYWAAFRPTPELVVLFVPGEAFLAPALEQDPALLEHAMARRVVIATPTTLVAMLRTVAYAWQQQALTDNAREVFELGQELYQRLGTLGGHVDKLGRSLRRSVEDYNAAVGSLERSVLRPARRLAELRVTDRDLAEPAPVEEVPRPLTAPELLDGAEQARLRVVGEP